MRGSTGWQLLAFVVVSSETRSTFHPVRQVDFAGLITVRVSAPGAIPAGRAITSRRGEEDLEPPK
jgi:hypothetical protein